MTTRTAAAHLLAADDATLANSILVLWSFQTVEERKNHSVCGGKNGRGFSAVTVREGSRLAAKILAGRALNAYDLASAAKIVHTHRRQLATVNTFAMAA